MYLRIFELVNEENNEIRTRLLGDFRDSTNTNDDYGYDANGNIIKDYNRHMYVTSGAGAHFNILDKPDSMVIAGKSTTYYTYDAGGNVLKKIVKDLQTNAQHSYVYQSGFVYLNDTLQYGMTEEGRFRIKDTSDFVLDFFIKDHMGNIRTVLTEETKLDVYPRASMEGSTSATEEMFYSNLPETRVAKPAGFPAEPGPDGGSTPMIKCSILISRVSQNLFFICR